MSPTVSNEDVDKEQQQFARRRSSFKCLEVHPDLSDLIATCLADKSNKRLSSKEILTYFNNKVYN